jgi:GH18 family chitinase
MVDLKLDGLDVDYEVDGADAANVTAYALSIQAMREAIDQASKVDGRPREPSCDTSAATLSFSDRAP